MSDVCSSDLSEDSAIVIACLQFADHRFSLLHVLARNEDFIFASPSIRDDRRTGSGSDYPEFRSRAFRDFVGSHPEPLSTLKSRRQIKSRMRPNDKGQRRAASPTSVLKNV